MFAFQQSTSRNGGSLTWIPDPNTQALLETAPPEMLACFEELIGQALKMLGGIITAAIHSDGGSAEQVFGDVDRALTEVVQRGVIRLSNTG
ncbi:MAG TPA: hypothetical protein VMT30_01370 [Candidatus Saccharimonadia bacterium]|nr:hypothetical protein [Candidatus Saccharimonadia bacterium]